MAVRMVAAQPLEVRARAVAAATRLFAAHGFDATSIQAVADEVGVTKQAVLHHFPSKEQLRQAVLDGILAHWNDTLPRLLLAATASEDRFDAVFGELHRFFAADPDRARVVMREALDRPAEMRALLKGPVKPWLGAVAGYIRAGQESGRHAKNIDPEAYVVHVLLLVLAATAAAGLAPSVLDQDGARDAPRDSPRDSPRVRYDRELARIAKASLFGDGLRASEAREATGPRSKVQGPRSKPKPRPPRRH